MLPSQTYLASELSGLGNFVEDTPANRVAWRDIVTVDANGAAIAAALNSVGRGSRVIQGLPVNGRGVFVVTRVRPSFRLAAVYGASIAGTPLPRDTSPTVGNNTFPTLNLVDIRISVASRLLASDWIPADLWTSPGDGFAQDVFWRFMSGDEVVVDARNRTGETATGAQLRGVVALEGYCLAPR